MSTEVLLAEQRVVIEEIRSDIIDIKEAIIPDGARRMDKVEAKIEQGQLGFIAVMMTIAIALGDRVAPILEALR